MSNVSLVRYGRGTATGLAAAGGVALVAAEPSSPTVELLAAALADGRPMAGVLAQLMAGNGEQLPAFVVARREADGLRVVLRGDVDVRLHGLGGDELFTATGLSTWREALFADVQRVDASVDSAAPLAYSIAAGSFPAGRLEWSVPLAAETTSDATEAPLLEVVASGEPVPVVAAPPIEAQPGLTTEPESEPEPPAAAPTPVPPAAPTPVPPAAPPPVPPPATGTAADIDDLDFSHLVEHTVYRQVEDAAVRVDPALVEAERHPPAAATAPPPPPPAPADSGATIIVPSVLGVMPPSAPHQPPAPQPAAVAPAPLTQGDHDGHTVMRRTVAPQPPVVTVREAGHRPSVLAVRCPQGHPNPPQTPECRVCRQNILSRATEHIERPTLGVLRFSTGLVVPVNGPLAIGRRPPEQQMLGAEVATPVTIDDSELSRFHAAVLVSDWYVQLADQGSTNGTMVSNPGQADQVLRPNERVQLAHGCAINLGGAVGASFDVV